MRFGAKEDVVDDWAGARLTVAEVPSVFRDPGGIRRRRAVQSYCERRVSLRRIGDGDRSGPAAPPPDAEVQEGSRMPPRPAGRPRRGAASDGRQCPFRSRLSPAPPKGACGKRRREDRTSWPS